MLKFIDKLKAFLLSKSFQFIPIIIGDVCNSKKRRIVGIETFDPFYFISEKVFKKGNVGAV
jgi:hypothetical protein